MSFYNMLFGMNPAADFLLSTLGLTRDDTGRFRDCYAEKDDKGELRIVVHTRNGGGNRDDYQDVFDTLAAHPNYLYDQDDDFDCTYADIVFSVPEKFKSAVFVLTDESAKPPAERWQELFAKMQSGAGDPDVNRAIEAMRPTMEKIVAALEASGSADQKLSPPQAPGLLAQGDKAGLI